MTEEEFAEIRERMKKKVKPKPPPPPPKKRKKRENFAHPYAATNMASHYEKNQWTSRRLVDVYEMARLGMSETLIVEYMQVDREVFEDWKENKKYFEGSMKRGWALGS